MDADRLTAAMVDGARKYFDAAVAPLVARIAELEARPLPKEPDPEETKAVVEEAISQIEIVSRQDIEAIVNEAIKLIPPVEMPKVPDADEIAATVSEAVKAAVDALPPPEPVDLSGYVSSETLERNYSDLSARINNCVPASVAVEQLKEVTDAIPGLVQEAVSALPPAEPGKSVTADDVRPMLEEIVEKAVAAIPPARDGVGLAGALIDRDGNLVLTLTDGKALPLGKIVGDKGRDGFGFDDMYAEFDGERKVTLRWTKGEHAKEFSFDIPAPIDRGVWREGAYEKGDFVSFGGSGFIAQRKTSDKPETSDAWRLSVKRGRDGKDGTVKQIPGGPVQIGLPGKEKK